MTQRIREKSFLISMAVTVVLVAAPKRSTPS
jgi:hypothetical protein